MEKVSEKRFIAEVLAGIRAKRSQAEIAASLGITGSAVSTRCRKLRERGIAIPPFPSGKFDSGRIINRIGFKHPNGHLTITKQFGAKCVAVCDCENGDGREYFTHNLVTGSTIRCALCRPKKLTPRQRLLNQRQARKRWESKNKEKTAQKNRRFKANNPQYHKTWYQRNRTKAVAKSSAWAKRIRMKINEYEAKKRREDSHFKMATVLRRRLNTAIKNHRKKSSSEKCPGSP